MKLGLIGCGKVADFFHVPAIRATPGVRIEAIADIDKDRVERFGRKYKIENRYLDYHSMFDKCRIDSVLICTPPRTHAQIILDSVDHGLHVLCEKPFVSTVSELDAIAKSADKNLTIFPVHNYVFTPSLWLAEHLMKNRDLGRLEEMDAHLAVGFNTWRSATDYRNRDPAGVITDLLYHVIYVAHRVCGPIMELVNIDTKKDNDHVARIVRVEGKSKDGAPLRLSASWNALLPHFKILLRHSNSSIDMDLIWHPYRISVQGVEKEKQPKPLKGRFGEIRSLMSMSHPSFKFLHQDFRNSVVSKSTPQVTIDQAKETLQTIQRITERAGK